MSTERILHVLDQQIETLAREIEPIGHVSASQARFDIALFSTKGTRLRDYLAEIKTNLQQLNQEVVEKRSAQVAFIAERLVAQITAMQRELATQSLRKTHQTPERKSHDNYTKLAETQQFERRLIAMIEDRETTLGHLATFSDQQRVQKELAALEGRLMRCRQALAKIERQIERQEKGF
ncbi:primosomal replication protein PriC [Rahnella aquatilis]|uniref:Primosomal replication protein N n=1 Tax=Rahnella aquatilis (strain ATCC 33071 / DSM 4594 / JCM 1683 / NBRC 105701 / NCIMB 13365 / CIP 78.65) TaxID=745277 RepID=H2IYY0_RAHAC|nr:primosomal replication protein [Rahnella aquatilis]AEX53195.1 primosomal replication protein N'' [Rahnella aquatilis CIP 78.65 = ATCC 33071]KFD04074.1 primosomal replication protein N'' [Rahnella aquatilis CIP 78.65 = ATCC 33071]